MHRTLKEGESAGMVLESGGGRPRRLPDGELERLSHETAEFWRGWLRKSTYTGRWREMVTRSAMTLKLMTYAPSGALVAAPTTGLPEQVGGERNWDYRYTWIRDASFSVHALLGLGYVEEAAAFGVWVRDRLVEHQGSNGDCPLRIMYRVDGSSDLSEETLDHWEGWRGSRPVRIGNGASGQLQLDIFGEAMDAFAPGRRARAAGRARRLDRDGEHDGLALRALGPARGRHLGDPRRPQGLHLRALPVLGGAGPGDPARRAPGRPADILRWRSERDRIYRQVMERGWNPKERAFVQHYGTDVLDSSLLLMPLMGFVSPFDPMWLDTLEAMDKKLVSDSLVYRYDPSASPDGLRGHEGTFSLCTFWYVDALARSGRMEEAALTFQKMHTYANHLGLYSEEIGLTGEQLGNFPQAFSHLSLINAAINLDYQLDHGVGEIQPMVSRIRRVPATGYR